MRILVHICCGPCAITVLQRLAEAGHECAGLFFNPNIHPLAEYLRRREGAARVAERLIVPLYCADAFPVEDQHWLSPDTTPPDPAAVAAPRGDSGTGSRALPPAADPALWLRASSILWDNRNEERCAFCWNARLRYSARAAARLGYDAFTSSLLYSRHQNHAAIRAFGEKAATAAGVAFVYEDFRTSWQRGITLSKEWGIYRQPYCGCLFSEYDRYGREFARLRDDAAAPLRGE